MPERPRCAKTKRTRATRNITSTSKTSRRESLANSYRRLPHVRFEDLLPQTDRLRRHFHQLILAYELDRLLEIQQARRHQPDRLIRRRCPHVRELLLFHDVDVEI